MTPTDELRTELRGLIDEAIPDGGTADDTRFTQDQIDRLLAKNENVYFAAADGWTRKTGMIQREHGPFDEMGAGDEQYRRVNLSTAVNYAKEMASMYRERGEEASPHAGSRVFAYDPPDVLGIGEDR